MKLHFDSESWSEALHSGSLVGCQGDSHMVKAESENLTPNIHAVGDQSAWEEDKETAYRSLSAWTLRSQSGDCSRTDAGQPSLMKVEIC